MLVDTGTIANIILVPERQLMCDFLNLVISGFKPQAMAPEIGVLATYLFPLAYYAQKKGQVADWLKCCKLEVKLGV